MTAVKSPLLLVVLVSMCMCATAQEESSHPRGMKTEKVTIIPGAHFKAGWVRRIFFGSLWRDLWTTPMEVSVLDLGKYAGGLTPIQQVSEPRGLRFIGEDGRLYEFRSIERDIKAALPLELRETFVYEVAKDMMGSINPLSSVMAEPFLHAAGVLHVERHLVVLPDDEKLAEFREQFSGALGTIESFPMLELRECEELGEAISTGELFGRLAKDNDDRVDAVSFLKGRLMDIYLGNWNRHADEWQWICAREGGVRIWKAVLRESDWAFARYDGLVPWLSAKLIPQIQPFGEKLPKIVNFTWTGRDVDRRVLSTLDKSTWDSVTTFVVLSLGDSLIEDALRLLPQQVYAKMGETLLKSLRSRRLDLREASDDYYNVLASHVDVRGSNESEYATISFTGDQQIKVALYERDEKTGEKDGEPSYDRVFHSEDTKEVRLYLLGGDDIAVLDGRAKSGISLKVIGGEGEDKLINSSELKRSLLDVIPFVPSWEAKIAFYDSDREPGVQASPSASATQVEERPGSIGLGSEGFAARDWGHAWKFELWLGADSDDGLFLGGGPVLYQFGFRADPYVYRMGLRFGFATATRKVRAEYSGEFLQLVRGARVLLYAKANQLDIDNFFGTGNETTRNEKLEEEGFYNFRKVQLWFRTAIEFPVLRYTTLSVGASAKYVNANGKAGTILDTVTVNGIGKVSLLFMNTALRIDRRDHPVLPTHGILLELGGSYSPPVFSSKASFGEVRIEARSYLTRSVITPLTLAVRVVGEKNWGGSPFHQISVLGGSRTIRGLLRERYVGGGMVLGNAELRFFLPRFQFLRPAAIGMFLFGDTGRVFVSGEDSDQWHSSVGAGLWLSILKPEYTLSASIARSSDGIRVQAMSGLMF